MMNEINIKKMEELLADKEFAKKVDGAGSYEKAYELFAQNGVDVSREDFLVYIDECHKENAQGLVELGGELGAEILDMVHGGVGLFLLGTVAAWAITKALDNAWSKPNYPVPHSCCCCR